jgi:hypothetical protein
MSDRHISNREQGPSIQEHFRRFVEEHELIASYVLDEEIGLVPVNSFSTLTARGTSDDPLIHKLTLNTSLIAKSEDLLSIYLDETNEFTYEYGGRDLDKFENHALVTSLLQKLEVLEKSGMARPESSEVS